MSWENNSDNRKYKHFFETHENSKSTIDSIYSNLETNYNLLSPILHLEGNNPSIDSIIVMPDNHFHTLQDATKYIEHNIQTLMIGFHSYLMINTWTEEKPHDRFLYNIQLCPLRYLEDKLYRYKWILFLTSKAYNKLIHGDFPKDMDPKSLQKKFFMWMSKRISSKILWTIELNESQRQFTDNMVGYGYMLRDQETVIDTTLKEKWYGDFLLSHTTTPGEEIIIEGRIKNRIDTTSGIDFMPFFVVMSQLEEFKKLKIPMTKTFVDNISFDECPDCKHVLQRNKYPNTKVNLEKYGIDAQKLEKQFWKSVNKDRYNKTVEKERLK